MKKHCCKDCGTTDPKAFYAGMKSLCLADYKKRYKRYYKRDRTTEVCKCTICGEIRITEFYPNNKTLCKAHYHPETRAVIATNTSSYLHVLSLQKGGCAVCGASPKELGVKMLQVDVVPNTELVRGLLCMRCLDIARKCTRALLDALIRYEYRPPTRGLLIKITDICKEIEQLESVAETPEPCAEERTPEEDNWLGIVSRG